MVNGEGRNNQKRKEVKSNDAIIGLDNVMKHVQQSNLDISESLTKELHNLGRFVIYKKHSIEK